MSEAGKGGGGGKGEGGDGERKRKTDIIILFSAPRNNREPRSDQVTWLRAHKENPESELTSKTQSQSSPRNHGRSWRANPNLRSEGLQLVCTAVADQRIRTRTHKEVRLGISQGNRARNQQGVQPRRLESEYTTQPSLFTKKRGPELIGETGSKQMEPRSELTRETGQSSQ